MTAVPTSFQAEPGYFRCGNSFDRSIVATGEIPGRNGFGKNHKRFIPRVAKVPGGKWWSTKSAAEASFRGQVVGRLDDLRGDLVEHGAELGHRERDALEWLCDLAEGNLARVDALYAFWEGHKAHPITGAQLPVDPDAPSPIGPGTYARVSEWPLPTGDAIFQYMGECTGKSGEWVEDREIGEGGNVVKVRDYYCPDENIRQLRTDDRFRIHELLLDAARAVRCGQYGLWRVILYKRALDDWREKYGHLPDIAAPTEPGPRPRPGVQVGGGLGYHPRDPGDMPGGSSSPWQAGPVEPHGIPPRPQVDPDARRPGPPEPSGGGTVEPHDDGGAPDWYVPDPDDLPDPGPEGPGGEGGGVGLEPGLGSDAPAAKSGGVLKAAAVIGILAGSWWAFNKVL